LRQYVVTVARIEIPEHKMADFCQRWKISELALFGSVLRDDFRPDSDVDVLVTFAADARWTLFDIVHVEDELKEMFGREIDLSERRAVEKSENYIRRRSILKSARTVYVAG
jgi:predicted nucleotidyltransferase